jgi:hypothetical protein
MLVTTKRGLSLGFLPSARTCPYQKLRTYSNHCICQARMANLSEPCWVYSPVFVIVSARASPCKLKCLPFAINSWSCSVLPVAVSLVSAGLIVSSGRGSRGSGVTGDLP